MPILDGMTAAAAIKKMPEGKQVIIIAVTAHAFQDERREMINAGCNDFIAKPFSVNAIFNILEKYLDIKLIKKIEETTDQKMVWTLNDDELAELSEQLRKNFEIALIRLDMKQISELINQISLQNAGLGKILYHYAELFDYKTILKALQNIKK